MEYARCTNLTEMQQQVEALRALLRECSTAMDLMWEESEYWNADDLNALKHRIQLAVEEE